VNSSSSQFLHLFVHDVDTCRAMVCDGYTPEQRAQVIADFPRGDFKNEFIEVQTCSALKKPLTTFGTVNFDYIEYRDPTFHKPNACTRIRNTPWLS